MVQSVVWLVSKGQVQIKFISTVNSTAGFLTFSAPIDDSEFGIYDTSALLKLMSIMKDDVNVTLLKEHDVYMKMVVTDDVYDGSFSLADIKSIEEAPSIEEPKVYEVSFPLDKEFKEQYLKAYKALGSINRFTLQTTKTDVKITLGNKESYANKISFSKECPDFLPLKKPKSFSGDAIAEIFKCNNDIFYGLLEVSEEGLMKVTIKDDNYTVNYYLIELEDV